MVFIHILGTASNGEALNSVANGEGQVHEYENLYLLARAYFRLMGTLIQY